MSDSRYIAALEDGVRLLKQAHAEGRGLTTDEEKMFQARLQAADAYKSIEGIERQLSGGLIHEGSWSSTGGPGDVFVRSQGYKSISSPDSRPQQWSSGLVEVSSSPMLMKGTLLESGAGGPGGRLTPAFYQPGINSKLFEPLGVAAVFGSSQTSASQVRYITEAPPRTPPPVWRRVASSRSRRSPTRRWWSRSRRSRRSCRSPRRYWTMPVGPVVSERPARAVREAGGGAPVAPRVGDERARRADARQPRHQHLQRRGGRQRHRDREVDREHGRLGEPGARLHRDALQHLAEHQAAP